MKKTGFTMIELVFVVIIIGVLTAIALPKFDNVDDMAKVNSEISTMNNLTSALKYSEQKYTDVATPEWQGGADLDVTTYDVDRDGYEEKYVNGKLANLHFPDAAANEASQTSVARSPLYITANTEGTLFQAVSQSGGKGMTVVAYEDVTQTNGDDTLLLTGKASHATSGAKYPSAADSAERDFKGKPDRNDFWVFNGSSDPVTVVVPTSKDTDANGVADADQTIKVSPYQTVLVDVDGTTAYTYTNVTVDGTAVVAP